MDKDDYRNLLHVSKKISTSIKHLIHVILMVDNSDDDNDKIIPWTNVVFTDWLNAFIMSEASKTRSELSQYSNFLTINSCFSSIELKREVRYRDCNNTYAKNAHELAHNVVEHVAWGMLEDYYDLRESIFLESLNPEEHIDSPDEYIGRVSFVMPGVVDDPSFEITQHRLIDMLEGCEVLLERERIYVLHEHVNLDDASPEPPSKTVKQLCLLLEMSDRTITKYAKFAHLEIGTQGNPKSYTHEEIKQICKVMIDDEKSTNNTKDSATKLLSNLV